MNTVEKILRFGLAALLIVGSGEVFFRFSESPEPPVDARDFLISLTAAGYIWPAVGGVFLVSGILLLFNRTVGTALVLLFPVTANIALYLFFLDNSLRSGFPGMILCLLHLWVTFLNRSRFRSLIKKG